MKLKKLIKFFNENGADVTIEDVDTFKGYVTQGKAIFPFSDDDLFTLPTLRQVMGFWDEAVELLSEGYLPEVVLDSYYMVKKGVSSYYEWDSNTNTFKLQEYEEPEVSSISFELITNSRGYDRFLKPIHVLTSDEEVPFVWSDRTLEDCLHSMTISAVNDKGKSLMGNLKKLVEELAVIQRIGIRFEKVN